MAVLDQKEAKALADILALVVDENENVAQSALAKLRQRAKQDSVTGGALKNLFNTIAARPAAPPPRRPPVVRKTTGNPERDLASARETIGELTVRTMELTQELSAARTSAAELMADIVAARSARADAQQALWRQSSGRMRAWCGGAVIGGVLAAGLMLAALQSFPRFPVDAAAQTAPGGSAAQPAAALSPDAVKLTTAGVQVGPVALNMNWSNATPGGTRWRVLPSSVPSGYSLLVDLGDGQAATVGAPTGFMETDEAARNRSVEALRAQLPHGGTAQPR